MTTPLEELAEYVGPNGPGCKKPCLECGGSGTALRRSGPNRENCNVCRCVGFLLDTEAPLFKALWRKCPGCIGCDVTNSTMNRCGQTGHQRRSRAEAALRLIDTADRWEVSRGGGGEWKVWLHYFPRASYGHAPDWPNAVAAAVLVRLKEEAVP